MRVDFGTCPSRAHAESCKTLPDAGNLCGLHPATYAAAASDEDSESTLRRETWQSIVWNHHRCLCTQVRDRLPEAGDPKIRNKLAALLQHAARGVAANPTAAPADLLLFCHGVLTDGM